jgi:hypothetical protein
MRGKTTGILWLLLTGGGCGRGDRVIGRGTAARVGSYNLSHWEHQSAAVDTVEIQPQTTTCNQDTLVA